MGIKLKRSAVAGKTPATTDLEAGELAVNTNDGRLFLKKSVSGVESIVEVGPVVSVAGKTGIVTLAKADVGLGNVDNTSDAAKPVSTATQTALNGKANTAHTHAIADVTSLQTTLNGKANTAHTHAIADVTSLQTTLEAKAPLESPGFIGTPTAPSAAGYVDTAQIATTAQVYDTVTTVPENAQTGTAYTLALSDAGRMVTLNNAAAVTLTIPTNAVIAFPVGTRIDILQWGTGQVTVAGNGVTIRSSGSKLRLTGQYSGATLWKKASDTWALIGDIAT